ncbi:MAG TPA: hypothetical protein VF590_15075 [Isosphaeraceae bacterium]|jgi:hypothetical protein
MNRFELGQQPRTLTLLIVLATAVVVAFIMVRILHLIERRAMEKTLRRRLKEHILGDDATGPTRKS